MKTPLRNRASALALFATTALVVSAGSGMAQSFASTDTPRLVPPSGTSGSLTSTITVPAIGMIDDVNLSFNLTHTWAGDLLIRLTAPSGTNFVAVNNETSG
jgi:subtilisin-like proprotein convertase family protein